MAGGGPTAAIRDRSSADLNITIKQPVGKLGNIYAPFFIESDIKKN